MSRNRIKFLVQVLVLLLAFPARAQDNAEKQAFDLLDKAMGPLGNPEGSFSLYFEGIAQEQKNPADIFTLPAYKVHRGGYLFSDGDKFELRTGVLKGLCDGRLLVMIDEVSKIMIVDSVRDWKSDGQEEMSALPAFLTDSLGEMQLKYEGKESLQGKSCHKIRGTFPRDPSKHVLYYVEIASGRLLLMGEFHDGAYDVFWLKKIGPAVKGHAYDIHLPDKAMEKYYGYQVYDFRFVQGMPDAGE